MGKQKKETAATRKIRISINAHRNLNEITGYIAIVNKQPLNAIKVGDAIFKAIDHIASNPFAYKECEALPTKSKIYRRAVCLSWLIIYKITTTEIIILGIIHGSRKPSVIKSLKSVK